MRLIKYNEESRNAVFEGIKELALAVKTTLGPKGRNVIYERRVGQPSITKDGVTVAINVLFDDPFKDTGATIVREAAQRTNDEVGDGPQPLYSKIYTPEGFKLMGDIKIGDEICGTDGTFQKVVGVFPKGQKKIFKVKFADGREVECSADHLWTITLKNGVRRTMTTRKLINSGIYVTTPQGYRNYKYYITNTFIKHSEKELPINPYTLGLLIGDGSLSGTGSVEISLGKDKEHILKKIILPEGISINYNFIESKNYFRVKIGGKTPDGKYIKDILNELGLYGIKSKDKFIPELYLRSSEFQRVELLAGLLDTGGYFNKRGLYEFSTVSKQLSDDIIELSRSLGYVVIHRLHSRENDKNSYSDTPIHRISQLKGYKWGLKIVDIEATDRFTEMQCIKVSNPDSLYITDNYVSTHNTTTSIVLAEAIIKKGMQVLNNDSKVSPVALKEGIDLITKVVIEKLKEYSISVENSLDIIENVATISGNNSPKVGKIIRSAIENVGDGVIEVESSNTNKTSISVTEGMEIDGGYMNSYFVNNHKKRTVEFENPLIFVSNFVFKKQDEIIPYIQKSMETGRPLVMFVDDLQASATSVFMANVNEKFHGAIIKTPSFGNMQLDNVYDIAAYTGATAVERKVVNNINKQIPLENIDSILGSCDKIIIGDKSTRIIRGKGNPDKIQERLEQIEEDLKASTNYDKEILLKRKGRLNGKACIIQVGGQSKFEMEELKDRVEDALNATRSAIKEGIVPGGGITLYNISKELLKESIGDLDVHKGSVILLEALQVPFEQILYNADIKMEDALEVMKSLKPLHKENARLIGYDAKTNSACNMYEAGIIDPTLVPIHALKNAASIAGTFLTTECVIVHKPIDEPPIM